MPYLSKLDDIALWFDPMRDTVDISLPLYAFLSQYSARLKRFSLRLETYSRPHRMQPSYSDQTHQTVFDLWKSRELMNIVFPRLEYVSFHIKHNNVLFWYLSNISDRVSCVFCSVFHFVH